jgi:hypothetical protein
MIPVLYLHPHKEALAWCFEQFGVPNPTDVRWYHIRRTFYFRSETDAVLFKLRWS